MFSTSASRRCLVKFKLAFSCGKLIVTANVISSPHLNIQEQLPPPVSVNYDMVNLIDSVAVR